MVKKNFRTEFGTLLDELIVKTGKKDFAIAKEMGWSPAHLSKSKTGKTNLSDHYVNSVGGYFIKLNIGGDDVMERLEKAALLSQCSYKKIRTESKPSDKRLNRFRHDVEDPLVRLDMQLSVPRQSLPLIRQILIKLETASDELLKKIKSLLG